MKRVEQIVIIGGGFAGSLLALKLSQKGKRPVIVESAAIAGPGLAYGKALEHHLLNVPAQRMEVGLEPSFGDWLKSWPTEIAAALANDGELAKAFFPRHLFGKYIQEHVEAGIRSDDIVRLRGEVTSLKLPVSSNNYALTMADGRQVEAQKVVLATGNLLPATPFVTDDKGQELGDHPAYVRDPWAPEALANLERDASVLLIGTGLTMADIGLSLKRQDHTGTVFALSRRGLLPLRHQDGGVWPFHDYSGSPRRLLRQLRNEAGRAAQQNIPWQRILDTVRPQAANIWAAWTRKQKGQFLRHVRPYWDVHRHRLAPAIAREVDELLKARQLVAIAGRIQCFRTENNRLHIHFTRRHGRKSEIITVDRVLNCTGPQSNIGALGLPLFMGLMQDGLILPDALGLGIETDDARVLNALGRPSSSLFAVGSLTRPAWWEVTAVPEIAAQVTRLATILTEDTSASILSPSLARDFLDLGAGI